MSNAEEKEKEVYDLSFKVLLAGDPRVGKSSIIKHYVKLLFRPVYIKTAAVDVAIKNLPINGQEVKLHILDIPGDAL